MRKPNSPLLVLQDPLLMVWRGGTENDPREKSLHVGVTRGSSPGDVTTIVATRGKVMALAEASFDKYFQNF